MQTPPIFPSVTSAPELPLEASQFTPASIETGKTSVQTLAQPHLGPASLKLFHDLTGHQLHLIWHAPQDFEDPRHLPLLCPMARGKLNFGRSIPPNRCVNCQRDMWYLQDTPLSQGSLLTGACGSTCFWAALQHNEHRAATLVLHTASPSPGFDQAVQLLHQFLRGTEAALAAGFARLGPDSATPQPTRLLIPGEDPHGNAIVHTMLEYLHTHYQRNMGLADVASALKMNASYLSHLFSTTTGVSFHHCLANLRLEKAKELLCNTAMRVCEVAAATGFSSPNHFNNVFKATLGFTPSDWRKAALQLSAAS